MIRRRGNIVAGDRWTRRARPVIGAAALTATVLFAGCSAAGGGGADSEVLRFGLSGEPQDIRVGADQGATGYMLNSLVHRGLMKYDLEGEVVPALAADYTVVDNATYKFVLHEGLTFSDDTPLTSEHVKNTLLYLGDPDNGARTYQGMSNIESIDVEDDTHLTVHLRENDPDFLEYLAESTAFIAPDEALDPEATAEVGAGPFRIESEQEGVQMQLVPNENFYDADAVALEGIDLIYYPDTSARTSALISGDVDFIDYVAWEEFEQIENTEGLVLDAEPGLLMDIEFNVTDEPFDDPLVRQAVAHAVNRDNVAAAAFFGNAAPVYGLPLDNSGEFASETGTDMYEYDPDRARDLLAEAGYPDGFSTTLLTTSQYAFHQDTALTVQEDLQAVGIDVSLDSPDWPTRMEKAGAPDYAIKINGWGGLVTSPAFVEAYLGGPDVAKSFGYDNPELMEALALGRTADSDEERAAGYETAYEIMQEDVPMVNLVQRDQAFAYSDRLSGFKGLPGFLTFYSGYAFETASLDG